MGNRSAGRGAVIGRRGSRSERTQLVRLSSVADKSSVKRHALTRALTFGKQLIATASSAGWKAADRWVHGVRLGLDSHICLLRDVFI